jgi:hypothetical protein
MWPFRRKQPPAGAQSEPKPTHAEVRSAKRLRFLHEQDGANERELKGWLEPELRAAGIERAYLARVEYENPDVFEVALCLRGPEDMGLVDRLGKKFLEAVPAGIHLDIVFLDDIHEGELKAVCRPFYVR